MASATGGLTSRAIRKFRLAGAELPAPTAAHEAPPAGSSANPVTGSRRRGRVRLRDAADSLAAVLCGADLLSNPGAADKAVADRARVADGPEREPLARQFPPVGSPAGADTGGAKGHACRRPRRRLVDHLGAKLEDHSTVALERDRIASSYGPLTDERAGDCLRRRRYRGDTDDGNNESSKYQSWH